MTQLVYQHFFTTYQALYYLWQNKSVLKPCQIPKYFEHVCISPQSLIGSEDKFIIISAKKIFMVFNLYCTPSILILNKNVLLKMIFSLKILKL